MKKNLYKILALVFAMGLFVISCDDVSLTDTDVDTELAEDNALAAAGLQDVFGVVNGGTGASTGKSLATCATVEYTTGTKTLTIDFGTGCTDDDGITRKGMITVVFTGAERAWETGEIATITFTNFYRGNEKLEGSITIECISLVPISFEIIATNMVLTFADSKTIKWSSTETITLEKIDTYGSYWRFNGGTTGTCTGRSGKTFSRTSTNLLSSPLCKWFIDGSLAFTVGDDVTTITFTDNCGMVKVKRNSLPEIDLNLNQ